MFQRNANRPHTEHQRSTCGRFLRFPLIEVIMSDIQNIELSKFLPNEIQRVMII